MTGADHPERSEISGREEHAPTGPGRAAEAAETGIEELDTATCWSLLRSVPVCRLAVCTADGPHIFPVNHIVDHGSVIIRTAPGIKLEAATKSPLVAIEADGYDDSASAAWSVVMRGPAREIAGLHDLIDVEHLPLAPWQSGPKHRFLRIEPDDLTGRRFKIAGGADWKTPLSGKPRAPLE
jgi:hypothetical protein